MGICNSSTRSNGKKQEMAQQKEKEMTEDASKLQKLKISPHLILMGDSVLDNIAWINDKDSRMDVEAQMNAALKSHNDSWKCKNLAVDGNTTSSLIKSLNFHKLQKDQQFQPKRFQSLQDYLESDAIDLSTESPIIVLSVGGNDVLGCMYSNKQMSKDVVSKMKQNEFMKGYQQILDILINECNCEVIIVFCYEPHIRFCDSHNVDREELLQIMQWAVHQIFGIAERYKLPLIDMSRTGNPYNETHYSVSPIEPNEKMGSFLVDLTMRVLADFEWNSEDRVSTIYYGQFDDGNGFEHHLNDKSNRDHWMHSKVTLHPFPK